MPQAKGWIKLHRKLVENPVLGDPKTFTVFVRLLLMASWSAHRQLIDRKRYHIAIQLERGDSWISERSFVGVGINRTALRTALQNLIDAEMITVACPLVEITDHVGVPASRQNRTSVPPKTNQYGLIVSICNYSYYQDASEKPYQRPAKTVPASAENRTSVRERTIKNARVTKNLKNKNLKKRKEYICSDSLARSERSNQVDSLDDFFDDWWKLWTVPGTRRSRLGARRIYLDLLAKGALDHQVACRAVERYMAWCVERGLGPDKIKHPPRWLRDGCWDDEFELESERRERRRNERAEARERAYRALAEGNARDSQGDKPDREERS